MALRIIQNVFLNIINIENNDCKIQTNFPDKNTYVMKMKNILAEYYFPYCNFFTQAKKSLKN